LIPGTDTRRFPHCEVAVAVPFPAPGTTILVVDDERITRRVAYRILSEEGYRVFEAASAEEAMSVLDMAHRYIHLVILDVVMPVVDGVELGRRILERWPSLRLLYMSAHPAEVLTEHGLDDLRVRFLAKPFTHDELLGKVQETLDRRGARRSSGAERVADLAQ
jgi:two-component system cell cycle sensor histidine kinase/response regulator CckA